MAPGEVGADEVEEVDVVVQAVELLELRLEEEG